MSNSDRTNHGGNEGLQSDNGLKNFSSLNGNKNESKADNAIVIEKSTTLKPPLHQSSAAKNFNCPSKHAKIVDRKVTALDEYVAEKSVDFKDSNEKLDEMRDEICTEFAELLHRKCRKRILNVVVDEQTGLMLRRTLTALQTGGKDADDSHDTEVSSSSSEIKTANVGPSGNPLLFSQSIISMQQLPGNMNCAIAYRRKMSANEMKRTPTNRLTKYD
uniref:Uncharacterized protein n=1 Tax=Romanomermis culicivorax TaxID=13658 RepID=A0A915JI38_ROMCU